MRSLTTAGEPRLSKEFTLVTRRTRAQAIGMHKRFACRYRPIFLDCILKYLGGLFAEAAYAPQATLSLCGGHEHNRNGGDTRP